MMNNGFLLEKRTILTRGPRAGRLHSTRLASGQQIINPNLKFQLYNMYFTHTITYTHNPPKPTGHSSRSWKELIMLTDPRAVRSADPGPITIETPS